MCRTGTKPGQVSLDDSAYLLLYLGGQHKHEASETNPDVAIKLDILQYISASP